MPRTKQATVDNLVQRFARWDPTQADEQDLDNLDLFLTVRQDYLDQDPCAWRTGDFARLLLEVCPRKVQSDPSLLADGPAVLGRFLRFLEQTGRLTGTALTQQEAELAEVAPRFAAAMADTSRFGIAKSLVAGMTADGVQPTDPAAVQQWIAEFNARPFADRLSAPPPPLPPVVPEGPPVVLPPVTLAEEAELRQLAGAAALVVRVAALLSHVGPQGRQVTQTGALRLVDATALAAVCGDADRLHRPESWQGQVRRMADLEGVTEAYELACDTGLLHQAGTRVRRNLGAPGATDLLARATALADAALEVGVFVGDSPQYMADLCEAVAEALPGVLAVLYAAAEPVAVHTLAIELAADLGVVRPEPYDGTLTVRVYLERVFARFERLGMIERFGVQVPPDRQWLGELGTQTTSVALTPLGVWWLHGALPQYGVRTPLIGELASATAGELCDGLAGYPLAAGEAEIAAWTAARGPADAARQLAQLLADPQVNRRQFAVPQLDGLDGAADAVRPMLQDPTARPYARFWLGSHDLPVPAEHCHPDDVLLLFVDTAGLLAELGAAAEVVAQLPGLGSPGEQVELVRRLWRVESPSTRPVLTMLARDAPPAVSKAARKALHSLGSAGR